MLQTQRWLNNLKRKKDYRRWLAKTLQRLNQYFSQGLKYEKWINSYPYLGLMMRGPFNKEFGVGTYQMPLTSSEMCGLCEKSGVNFGTPCLGIMDCGAIVLGLQKKPQNLLSVSCPWSFVCRRLIFYSGQHFSFLVLLLSSFLFPFQMSVLDVDLLNDSYGRYILLNYLSIEYIKNNCRECLNILHLFLSPLHVLSFSTLLGYMFGMFGFGGFKGDSNSGGLLQHDNVSGYKRDGASSSRHIDEKLGW